MSEIFILTENLPPDLDLPPNVQDYLNRLKSLAESQQCEIKLIREKNQRLEHKLKTMATYNEELREQIKTISTKVQIQLGQDSQAKLKSDSKEVIVTSSNKQETEKDNKEWTVQLSENGDVNHLAIVDQIREAAAEVARDQFLKGMVYEETSGLYYDYKSGFYFDAGRSLYYDGNSGTYYSYNYETKTYDIHSQMELTATNEKTKPQKEKRPSQAKNVVQVSPKSEVKANRKRSFSDSSMYQNSKNSILSKFDDSNNSKDSKVPKFTSSSAPNSPLRKGNEFISKLDTISSCSEPEDGEISSTESSDSEDEEEEKFENKVEFSAPPTMLEHPAPCIRIIVTETKEATIPVGTLFIVTCTGGSVGREGDHEVLLTDDIGCSKVHARISYKENHYFVKDLGSSNGTFVNGKRLSKPKQESELREIGHGSLLQIGTTKLLCHVHPSRETCFECEPGLVLVKEEPKNNCSMNFEPKDKSRKKEMRELRKKYGLSYSGCSSNQSNPSYSDRAGERRKKVGSDNPFEKTDSAHVSKSIDSKNKGFKMLQKMGWAQGKGLGKGSEGRVEPIPVAAKNNRLGLGDSTPVVSLDFKTQQKADLWKKTQNRFNKIEVSSSHFQTEEEKN